MTSQQIEYGSDFFGDHTVYTKLPWTTWWILNKELSHSDTVLELGCGPKSRLRHFGCAHSTGVEIFDAYVQEAKRLATHSEIIKADVRDVEFEPGSFDVVVAIDVIEHFDKEEGLELLSKMKSWARKKAIVSVPNGFVPGHLYDDNPFQAHKAGYSVDELKGLGFEVRGIGLKVPAYIRWFAVRIATYPLRIFSYYFPKLAFDLVAIYRRDGLY